MCGLVGFVGSGSEANLRAMTDRLAHRGPDGQGIWIDHNEQVFLGHRRLAIIDQAGGAQPMWNASADIGVIFNGEIFNHLELRAELQAAGHVFASSHSDTEVLIHGYARWGIELPSRLNGQFAFVIFDRRANKLFLARDRFGEKPLYYSDNRKAFVFGSEVSALLLHPAVSRELDVKAAQKFFAYGFFPSPLSLYRDVRKLPAGHRMVFDLATCEARVSSYWRFRLEPDDRLKEKDEPVLVEELRSLLTEAVRRRLMSDVPLGLFLSGGIDSSAILAASARLLPAENIKTFTIGFTEPSFDESAFARELALGYGVVHHEKVLDLDGASSLLPTLLRQLDEPLADPSILPTHLLSRFTREKVTVALSGDGGDELFAGYDPFKALRLAQLYSRFIPRGLHKGAHRLAQLLPRSNRNMSLDFKIKRALLGLSWKQELWNPVWLSPADPDTIAEIFEQPLRAEELYEEAIELWSASDLDRIDKTLEFYTNFYLPENILTKVDRATMLTSLESRAVFLDNDVVEFCRRLPTMFKFRNGQTKVILKKALSQWLPKNILARRKKGFGIPLAKWIGNWDQPRRDAGAADLGLRTTELDRRWARHVNRAGDERLLLFAWFALAPHLQQ
jgi:asparagine synthase (glutamine-hydrolysing)